MAILPHVSGLEATVLIGVEPAAEFHSPDDAGDPEQNQAVAYIESQIDAQFSVKVRVSKNSEYAREMHDIAAHLYVDGSRVDGVIISYGRQYDQTGNYEHHFKGVTSVEGETAVLRRFKFANLLTNDRPLNNSDSTIVENARQLGDITIKLYRVKVTGSPIPLHNNKFTMGDLNDVPEKALKGKALSAKAELGATEQCQKPTTVPLTYIDRYKKPCATFSFRYRTLGDLKALMIIPRSVSPVPLEERPIEDLTPAELRDLLRRERELNAKVKKEKTNKRDRSNTAMAIDGNGESVKRQRADTDIETIDLT